MGPRSLTAEERHNLTCFTVGESLWGFQANLVASATVLTVLLVKCGASKQLISAIATIEAGAVLLPQLSGLWIFRHGRSRQRRLIYWHLYGYIPWLFVTGTLVACRAHLPGPLLPWLLIASHGCMMTTIGCLIAAWTDWTAGIFPQRIRGLATGTVWACTSLAGTFGGLTAGRLLQRYQEFPVFTAMYATAGSIAIVSILIFLWVRSPADAQVDRDPRLRELLAKFRHSLGERNFRRYLVGRLITSSGFCIGPLVTVHFLSPAGGALPAGRVVTCAALQTAMAALGSIVLGKLGDRAGHRFGALAGIAAQCVALTGLLLGQGTWACAGVYLTLGIATSAAVVSNSNMLLETCPHEHRLAHITVGNLVCSPALMSFPLLAGWAAQRWSLHEVFLASLGLSLTALLWVSLMVREPRVIALARQNGELP